LTAPVVLARRGGVRVNVLTMPVHDNPELDPVMRRFLLRKIRGFTTACGGQWRSTDASMRAVYEDLSRGGVWLILADAWRPEFSRLREHPFLGGMLRLPTGLERLARATGAALLQGWTDSDGPTRLRVTFRPLPDDGPAAVDAVIRHLEQQVVTRPWAWWQWGVFNRMWIGPKESV
jgi:lauroyl/myristoyl acyltransferase